MVELEILAQIREIGRETAKLVAERAALLRVLERLRSQSDIAPAAPRHSLERMLLEKRILDTMRAAGGAPISSRDILKEARAVNPKLKDATFRSHLHRLMKRALVAPCADKRGHWQYRGED